MTLAWWINRLRVMSPSEVLYRIEQMGRARFERIGVGLAEPPPPAGPVGRAWLEQFPATVEREAYIAVAERILDGQFRVFSLADVRLGFPPLWNTDPKTGVRAPLSFGKTLNYRKEGLVGDCKYLWEPNRHAELVTLAQTWRLTRQDRYAQGCRELLESWMEQCPYPLGINWTSSLELAIRLVNWSFAWHLLEGSRSPLFEGTSGEAFRRRWLDSIYRHCHFISHHLSLYSSANNHLLGELLGLSVGAITWPMWFESGKWLDRAWKGFERAALVQTAPDGVNREQATWYHHEVADMMLIAGLVGRTNGLNFGSAYWERLESMLDFIASIMDRGGHVPAFGDSDDALIVQLDPTGKFDAYRSLLATGAVLFSRGDLKVKAGVFDDKSRWLLGDDGAQCFEAISVSGVVLPPRREFTHGGYYVLGESFETDSEVRIVADVAPLGYLSIAAHGHADALAFTLSAGGREFLVDAGTYAYHTQKRWRDYFRGTSAHNTLRLDGADQSISGGNFLWVRHAHARCESWINSAKYNRLVGSHDGYTTLSQPVRHRRELAYEIGARRLRVIDSLEGSGQHDVEIFWHFAESCDVSLGEAVVYVQSGNASLELSWPRELILELVRGQEDPPGGWISRTFDVKVPCVTLIVRGTVSAGWSGVTEIRVSFGRPGWR